MGCEREGDDGEEGVVGAREEGKIERGGSGWAAVVVGAQARNMF